MTIYYPSPKSLQPFIPFFYAIVWEKKNYKGKIEEFALPSGMGFMVFQNIGRFGGGINNIIVEVPKFYTIGQQDNIYYMESDDDMVELTGAAFTPTGLFHLFGLDMVKLINKPTDTETILTYSLDEFTQSYELAKEQQDRINCVQNLLQNHLDKVSPQLNIIDTSIGLINDYKGCIAISDLVKKLHISERYFQKKFKLMVGINPSTYTRIVRFNYLFAEMKPEGTQDLKTLSALFNYYDFAHFSKDFKKYCGNSPSKFHVEKFNFLREIWIESPFFIKN